MRTASPRSITLPAIRLIHRGISFLHAVDVEYVGSLEHGITFDSEQIIKALRQVRKTHFRHRALFRGMNPHDDAARPTTLIDRSRPALVA